MPTRQTYTVKRPLPYQGRILQPGESVTLHPRQAQYLLGTHLERPTTGRAKNTKAGTKETTR